ncbi:hypothetical protein GCM10022222_62120 [Amycolatopsis ultiminotia]|uniref:FAD dependent oxidoreductase domain-containing protein n=1 Tax=Amycolatopsis ultiminotia TaxID=543629 RepID=A0ABP6XSY4_9PSEU
MRISVLGGGLAGALLAWRLSGRRGVDVRLVTGPPSPADATRSSGGMVRGFEPDPSNAEAAIRGLREIRADPALRSMTGYRETGSAYFTSTRPSPSVLAMLAERLPGSVSIAGPRTARARFGIADVPDGGAVVLERHAGYFDPGWLRHRLVALLPRLGVEVVPAEVRRVRPGGYEQDYRWVGTDVVVLAAGAWTGPLLADSGLSASGLRTKAIQYGRYPVEGIMPPPFVDEHSGLYGRPAGLGQLFLGLPTDRWDLVPGSGAGPIAPAEAEAVLAAARRRFPSLRLGRPVELVAAVDSYAPDGRLRLRTSVPGVHTFTGGSGGAAKTALAASASAADSLLRRYTAVTARQPAIH